MNKLLKVTTTIALMGVLLMLGQTQVNKQCDKEEEPERYFMMED
tara:strand:- start:1799 stop:1930 length:132 start_codon:yes stop_codon:yes gene_type:complete